MSKKQERIPKVQEMQDIRIELDPERAPGNRRVIRTTDGTEEILGIEKDVFPERFTTETGQDIDNQTQQGKEQ